VKFSLQYLIYQEKSLLLHCSGCSRHVHPNCLTPPWTGMITDDWACYTCKIVEDEEKEQDVHVADCSKRCIFVRRIAILITYAQWPQFMLVAFVTCRYDSAVEKRLKILDLIRSLDLPNNPLDDIIDQVVLVCWQ